jgi:acyl-CoA dehydrogenase
MLRPGMIESPYRFISGAYGKNHFELDRPFISVLGYYDYDHTGARLPSLGEFAGKDVYEIADYVDKVARPKLIIWSLEGDRVDRAWLDPAERSVLEKLITEYGVNKGPYTSGDWFGYFASIYLIGDPGIACILTVTNQTAYAVYKYGDSAAKRYLPSLIGEGTAEKELRFGATWFTEIQGGSDLGANTVQAFKEGNAWKLDGNTKYFSSDAGLANLAIVTARPRDAKPGAKGIALFLVPEFDSNGKRNFSVRRLKEKSGTVAVPTGEVEFHESEAMLLGEAEKGIYYTLENLMVSRLSNAVGALGVARKAYLEAYYYAKKRKAFGRSLIDHPLVQRDLLEMEVYIEGTMAVTFKAISGFQKTFMDTPPYTDGYHYTRLLTHISKNLTADMAAHVTRLAMELHGGIGFLAEFPVERWHREALITPIWEGPSNIQALDMLEVIVKKGAHLSLLSDLENMAKDIRGDVATGLYKDALEMSRKTLESLKELDDQEAQFQAKDVLERLGHSLAVAILIHMASVLDSGRLLTVADLYHKRFVRKAPLTRLSADVVAEIIEIDKSHAVGVSKECQRKKG